MSSRILGSKREISPTTLNRMSFSWSLATSCSSARMNSCIRIETSSAGRRQFSLENAKSVRNSTPRSTHERTVARNASTPLRCPATRGRRRCLAQRPLPSMMMATCRGTSRTSGTPRVELVNDIGLGQSVFSKRHERAECAPANTLREKVWAKSNGEQIGFLRMQNLVDFTYVSVRELLHVFLRSPFLVLGNRLRLEQVLEVGDRIATDIAHGDAGVFGFAVYDFDELLAPLLCQRGHRNAYHVARGRGVQTQVRIADRLLDYLHHLLFPRLDGDSVCIGKRHIGNLLDRHHRPVVIHLDMVQEAGLSAACPDLAKIDLERLDRFLHLLLRGFLDIGNHFASFALSNAPAFLRPRPSRRASALRERRC